jgi:uncharacterized protein
VSTVDDLAQETERWLTEVRRNNPGPTKRFRLSHPSAPTEPTLADVQLALAREHGYETWAALTAAASTPSSGPALSEREQLVARFLEFACWDHRVHGRGDYAMTAAAAMRILRRHADIAHDSLYTAVVCGDLRHVERTLDDHPDLVNRKGGPRGWEPLVYLCYARLPLDAVARNASAIATTLLDRGADPNAYYMAGDALYGTLVGAAGEGEQDAPPHSDRDALYALLLDRGADLYDIQVLYNTHFHGNVRWWLELTYARAVAAGHAADWTNAEWPMFDMGPYGSGARFLLNTAIQHRDAPLAEWLLAHGAKPDAAPPSDPRFSKRSLYDDAVRSGCRDIADLLVQHGAQATDVVLSAEESFVDAAMRLDRDALEALLLQHPELRASPAALHTAARRNRADVVALLLDLGISIEVENQRKQRALHLAASHGARSVVELLLERGADIDPRETNWQNTPLDFAVYAWDREMIDLLAPQSRDVWNLAFTGKVDRLRKVLGDEPDLAKVRSPQGLTPLWWLPDDEERAVQVVDLLLVFGADPSVQSKNGLTAAGYARKRGLDEAAARIEAAM